MTANRLDTKLIIKLLEAHKQSFPKDDGFEIFAIKRIDEQIELLKRVEYSHLMAIRGGSHLGSVREWMKCKARNGENVTWGSQDLLQLRYPLTVQLLEDLACQVAAAAVNDFKGLS